MTSPKDRYAGSDAAFDARHGVLFNKLQITDPAQLEQMQTDALGKAYTESFRHFSETHRFTEQDICLLHRMFLGEIFTWAGQYRNADLSSDDILWCRAIFVAQEMGRFDSLLADLTPFSPHLSVKEVSMRLAQLHGELILIHPFRDGNGRVTRLFCDLLLVQAGREPTHRTALIDEKHRATYLQAIRTYHFQADLGPLTDYFEELLRRPV